MSDNTCAARSSPALCMPTGIPKRILCGRDLHFGTVYRCKNSSRTDSIEHEPKNNLNQTVSELNRTGLPPSLTSQAQLAAVAFKASVNSLRQTRDYIRQIVAEEVVRECTKRLV